MTEFVACDIWKRLTAAVRNSANKADIAVAYFGKGAAKLLPLPAGSRLVVDASEAAVKSGQTCPADLLALVNRGVEVFSVPNLHAKVFVFGRSAYIGSANASKRSQTQLVEALLLTTDAGVVQAARQFVRDQCLHQQTPTLLKRLKAMYRPPQIPGGKKARRTTPERADNPALPRLLLAQLELQSWSDRDQSLHDTGLRVAKKRREKPREFVLESFRMTGRCSYQAGDVVIQVTDEGDNGILVSPPGTVRYVRSRKDKKGRVSFVYLERPKRKRRSLDAAAKKIGPGARKQLRQDGVVSNDAWARRILSNWTE